MSTEKEQAPPAVIPVPEVPKAAEKMAELDRMALELAKSRKLVAIAEAKTALANSDNAELNYKYVVLQLYMKYGLTEVDAISENGDIHRGAAAAALKQQAGS